MERKAKKVHFVGIGGIGMSALAQLFAHDGAAVSGSDRDPSPNVHDMLAAHGITVTVGHRQDNVPADADLVVYSDAVVEGSEGYAERLRARELGITEQSYFEALGEISKGKHTVAVAGTHGKTTTTGMLGKILKDVGASPTAVVGSIVKDFGSNYLHGD
ncbi:MAG TPA: Mur ligase domain-containing protein, partial [Candidatus Paceibacterota bacterium]|nr:Mur ligase domain-containing protein [Candidatus Paceibacterota bacterium]